MPANKNMRKVESPYLCPPFKIQNGRYTEFGVLAKKLPVTCAYVFEKSPIWLLVFTPKTLGSIYLVDFDDFSSLFKHLKTNHCDLKLYNFLVTHLRRSSFSFSSAPADSLYLVSGSVNFLNERAFLLRDKKFLFVTDHHCRVRKIPPTLNISLHRLKHRDVGGATTYEVLWGTQNYQFDLQKTNLKRVIGDFIDYGTIPHRLPTLSRPLLHTQLLPVKHLNVWIQYPTHYHCDGIGFKQLSLKELASLFGFPSSSRLPVSLDSFPMVPLQILDTLLMPLLTSIPSRQLSFTTNPSPNEQSKEATHMHLFWSPSEATSFSATKSDDAAVNTQLWDKRIYCLWPSFTPTVLSALRHLVLGYVFKQLFKEFSSYMETSYGSAWLCLVKQARKTSNECLQGYQDNLKGGFGGISYLIFKRVWLHCIAILEVLFRLGTGDHH